MTLRRIVIGGVLIAGLAGPSGAQEEPAGEKPAEVADPAPTAPEPHPHSPFVGDRVKRKHALKGKAPDAVASALGFLARHQQEDGGWTDPKGAPYRPGLTGLALLCFLAEGSSHLHGEHQLVIARGMTFLRKTQQADGCFGDPSEPRQLYNTALGTLALAEAYTLTLDEELRPSIERAVSLLSGTRGWRYATAPERGELPLTAWCVHALVVAQRAGFEMGPSRNGSVRLHAALDALDAEDIGDGVEFRGYGRQGGYGGYDGRVVYSSEVSVAHDMVLDSRARYTAMALAPLLLKGRMGRWMSKRDRAQTHHAASLLVLDEPSVETRLKERVDDLRWRYERHVEEERERGATGYGGKAETGAELERHLEALGQFMVRGQDRRLVAGDEHYAYWASLACWQLGGPYWRGWKKYREPKQVAASQLARGEDRGAFEVRSPFSTGRVCSTALRCLALQAPYRYSRAGDQLKTAPRLPKKKK